MDARQRITRIIVAVLGVMLVLVTPQSVRADMAPLPSAAASDLAPGQGTQVAMVDETVVVDIQPKMATDYRAAALVTADFTLRNLGLQTESMDVRFPLGYPALRAGAIPAPFLAQDLRIALASGEVATRTLSFDGAPWAVWPMQFPPGQDVHLRVTYRITGIDNSTYNTFFYVLATGAGWRGPIGQGDIIFRFPYPADPEMWLRPPEANEALPADGYYTASTPPFVVQGNELRWHFANLEPTSRDNVRLSVLNPPLWQAILDARHEAERRPGDAAAQIHLGEAYHAAIPMKHGWLDRYPFQDRLGALAEAALAKAVELAPNDPAPHLAYARYLAERAWAREPEPYYRRGAQELAQARAFGATDAAIDPVQQMLSRVHDVIMATPTPDPLPVPPFELTREARHESRLVERSERMPATAGSTKADAAATPPSPAGTPVTGTVPQTALPGTFPTSAVHDVRTAMPAPAQDSGHPRWPASIVGGLTVVALAALLIGRRRNKPS